MLDWVRYLFSREVEICGEVLYLGKPAEEGGVSVYSSIKLLNIYRFKEGSFSIRRRLAIFWPYEFHILCKRISREKGCVLLPWQRRVNLGTIEMFPNIGGSQHAA